MGVPRVPGPDAAMTAPGADRPPDGEPPRRFADHLLEYLREPTLWPVMIVAVAIFTTLGSGLLLAALAARNLFALLGLLLLAGMTADVVARELRSGGLGVVGGVALGLWGLSVAGALLAVALGLF